MNWINEPKNAEIASGKSFCKSFALCKKFCKTFCLVQGNK